MGLCGVILPSQEWDILNCLLLFIWNLERIFFFWSHITRENVSWVILVGDPATAQHAGNHYYGLRLALAHDCAGRVLPCLLETLSVSMQWCIVLEKSE